MRVKNLLSGWVVAAVLISNDVAAEPVASAEEIVAAANQVGDIEQLQQFLRDYNLLDRELWDEFLQTPLDYPNEAQVADYQLITTPDAEVADGKTPLLLQLHSYQQNLFGDPAPELVLQLSLTGLYELDKLFFFQQHNAKWQRLRPTLMVSQRRTTNTPCSGEFESEHYLTLTFAVVRNADESLLIGQENGGYCGGGGSRADRISTTLWQVTATQVKPLFSTDLWKYAYESPEPTPIELLKREIHFIDGDKTPYPKQLQVIDYQFDAKGNEIGSSKHIEPLSFASGDDGIPSQPQLNEMANQEAAEEAGVVETLNFKLLAVVKKCGDAEQTAFQQQAQEHWLQYRDASCQFSASHLRGGQAWEMEFAGCRQTLNLARQLELKALLQSFKETNCD